MTVGTVGWSKVDRVLLRATIGGLLAYMAIRAVSWISDWPAVWALMTDADHAIYLNQARRVLAGGPLYPAWELAAPFVPSQLPEVYPPATVYGLFVPMSMLPMPVWWILPLAIIAGVVIHHRPRGWALAGVLACLAMPGTWIAIAAGNPSLYVVAGIALATVRPSWAALALVKPTLWPFALLGIRSPAWWGVMVVYGVVALLMLPAWLDYATVLSNYRGGLMVPAESALLVLPVIAWKGAARETRA